MKTIKIGRGTNNDVVINDSVVSTSHAIITVSDFGEIFLYDDIHNIGEFCWPGPGPLPPPDRFFIGAFFRQGADAGYLIIKKDGGMTEYKRCSYKKFVSLSQLT